MTEQSSTAATESDDSAVERIRIENARELKRIYRELPWERIGITNAPVWRRCLAIVLDTLFICGVPALLLWLIVIPAATSLPWNGLYFPTFFKRADAVWIVLSAILAVACLIALLLTGYFMLGLRGTSFGRMIAGLRLIRTTEEDPVVPGFGAITLRALLIVAFSLIPPIGWIALAVSLAVDPLKRRRSWVDRATRLWLVDRRKGLDPTDRDALREARRAVIAIDERRESVPSLSTAYGTNADRYLPGSRSRLGLITERVDDAVDAPSLANMVRPPAGLSDALLAARSAPDPAKRRHPAGATANGSVAAEGRDVASTKTDTEMTHEESQQFTYATPQKIDAPTRSGASTAHHTYQPRRETSEAQHPDDRTRFTVHLDDGQVHEISGTAIIGRKPDAANWPGGAVVVDDGSRLISKSHAILQRIDGRLVLQDLGSVNGTYIEHGERWECIPADSQTVIPSGTRIGIGDCILTVSIVDAASDINETTTKAGTAE